MIQFKERYLEMHSNPIAHASPARGRKSQRGKFSGIRELTPDEDDDNDAHDLETHADPDQPWLDEFNRFLDCRESVAAGMTTIEWWGVRSSHYIFRCSCSHYS
jgi:hypothetical protein